MSPAFILFDLPFGILDQKTSEWDKKLTDEEFNNMVDYCVAHNTQKDFIFVFYVHVSQISAVHKKLNQVCTTVKQVIVHKTNMNRVGMGIINATELVVVGFVGNAKEERLHNMSPEERHNVYPSTVHNKFHAVDGVLNETEKPFTMHRLTQDLLGKNPHNQRALVLGAGAGGDAIAIALAGVHVVALEQNPRQLKGLRARLTGICDNPQPMMDELQRQLDFVEDNRNFLFKKKLVTKGCMREIVKRNFPFQSGRDQVMAAIEDCWVEVKLGETKCAACSKVFEAGYFVCDACGTPVCNSCAQACACKNHGYCSDSCLNGEKACKIAENKEKKAEKDQNME